MNYWASIHLYTILVLKNFYLVTEAYLQTKCAVSDLKLICSSSHSVRFQWNLNYRWISQCDYQVYKITTTQSYTNFTLEKDVNLRNNEYTVKGLRKDQSYTFKFQPYHGAGQYQLVTGNYSEIFGSTQEAGLAEDLHVSNIKPTSAVITWQSPKRNKMCIQDYKLEVCQNEKCINYTLQSDNGNSWGFIYYHSYFYKTVWALEPCTNYTAAVAAVDLDGVTSSQRSSQRFKTQFQAPGKVTNITVTVATPDSLTVTWQEPSLAAHCATGYVIVLSPDQEFKQKFRQDVVGINRKYTFTGLKECSLYFISIKVLSDEVSIQSQWIDPLEVTSTHTYTPVISNATVKNLTVVNISEDQIRISWYHVEPPLFSYCIMEFMVEVFTDKFNFNISTKDFDLVINDLQPCTVYNISVTAVFSWGFKSLQSANISARTLPGGQVLHEPVQNITILNKTANALNVSWKGPKFGMNCVEGYTVYLEDSKHKALVQELTNLTSFEFSNLKECEVYYVDVTPNYYAIAGQTTSRHSQRFRSTFLTNTTAEDNIKVKLQMTVGWDSLQLVWGLPNRYHTCVSEYTVQVCDPMDCKEAVTLRNHSYSLNNLTSCLVYTATVTVKLSDTKWSRAQATVSQLTSSAESQKSHLFHAVNVTQNSVTFEWQAPDIPTACATKFVLTTLDTSGSTIPNVELSYSYRNYSIINLKSCHNYSFKLKLVNENGSSTIEYAGVNVTTHPSDNMTVTNLELDPISLRWTLTQELSACVMQYLVTFQSAENRTKEIKTKNKFLTWAGNPCKFAFASVQMITQGKPMGKSAVINIRKRFEDVTFLSFKVNRKASRELNVILTNVSFACVSNYEVSWHASTTQVFTSPLTLINHSVTATSLLPCTNYTVVAQPWNGPFTLQTLSTHASTAYEEPKFNWKVEAISRAFNVSWKLQKEDTKTCLDHVIVTAKTKTYFHEVKAYSTSSTIMHDLVPCRSYTITIQAVGIGGKLSKVLSENKVVTPEVLPAPEEAIVVCVTRHKAKVRWNVASADSDCHFSNFTVSCDPQSGKVSYLPHHPTYNFVIDGLKPFMQYTCRAVVINSAGKSPYSEVTFITSEGVPSQPKNITVNATSSSEVQVEWSRPDQVHGSLSNYTVTLYNQTLRYKVALGCELPTFHPVQLVVVDGTQQVVFTGLLADMQFQVHVVAATKAGGRGPPSAPVTSTTPISESEPVRNMGVTVAQDVTTLMWLPPCLTGGPLTQFMVQLNGSTGHFHNLQLEKELKESYISIFNTSDLKAETIYEATITPVGLNLTHGQLTTVTFIVPPRIPAELNEEQFKCLPPVETSSHSAVVAIHRDLFPNTEGTVQYFALLVAESFPHRPDYGWLTNGTWPKTSTWAEARTNPTLPYQTSLPWKNPFQSTSVEVVKVGVGTEECSETSSKYCDGPLEPGTVYQLRIRGFTATGFRDSESIKFQTEDQSNTLAVFVLLIILTVVTACILICLAVWKSWSEIKEKIIIKKQANPIKTDLGEGLSIERFLTHTEQIISSPAFLKAEFDILKKHKYQYPQTVGRLAHNKAKNRYGNILPYDETRVVLEGDDMNDYINASHIKLQEAKLVHYLACQAPKEAWCGEFWKMIFQFHVKIIVMLCMPVENEKERCFAYYPSPSEVVMFDDIAIYCVDEEVFSNYIMRHIVADKSGVRLEVNQFHFIGWPDFGVPESPVTMVEFVKAVQQVSKQRENVMAVHCSAGVGRTGTFVAIDALMRLMSRNWNCKLNVLDVVHRLRQQRCMMVQTENQYKYIYECVKYALENHSFPIVRVRIYFYKKSQKAKQSGRSDSKEEIHLEELSLQHTPMP